MNSENQAPQDQKQSLSPQAKWVGYLVLGFGVLACIAVLLLALQKINPSSEAGPSQNAQQSPSRPNLDLGKQKKIGKGQMSGSWQTRLQEANATLQFKDDVYQIIIKFDYGGLSQRYSRGTYMLKKGALTFVPNLNWQEPDDGLGGRYLRLSTVPFTVMASQSQGRMIWQRPEQESADQHPFLRYDRDALVVWDKLP